MPYWRHIDAPSVFFLCRLSSYISMVGWAGAPQGAPVANKAGKTNSVQSTTIRLVS
ncbi:ash family protein [Pectobacterium aroidearum]|uniref:ash family protein n=1 Tax=Pectobacterium aroidearum TaxID=1201031 RepID=UPI003DA40322